MTLNSSTEDNIELVLLIIRNESVLLPDIYLKHILESYTLIFDQCHLAETRMKFKKTIASLKKCYVVT